MSVSKYFMDITVSNPEKSADKTLLKGGHTTYQVSTKTNCSSYEDKDFFVRRRYNDFVWLVSELQATMPQIWVPPIPEKQMAGRFKDETIETRQRGLQRFCTRIANHEVLRECELVKTFLEAKNWELKGEKKSQSGAVSQLFHKVAIDLDSRLVNHKTYDKDHAEFELLKLYLNEFDKNIKAVKTAVSNMTEKQCDMSDELTAMGESLSWLAQGETDLTDALTGFGQSSSVVSKMHLAQATRDDTMIVDVLKEYDALALQGLRSLKERDQLLLKFQDTSVRLKGKNEDLEKMKKKADAEKATETSEAPKKKGMFGGMFAGKDAGEQVTKLEKEIETKEKEKEACEEQLANITKAIRGESTHFHDTKIVDFKDMMRRYIDGQVSFCKRLQETWESLAPEVDRLDKVTKLTPGYGERLPELTKARKGRGSGAARIDDSGTSKDDGETGVKDDTDIHDL